MKNKISVQNISSYSFSPLIAVALVFGLSITHAEDDVMGSMPKEQPKAQTSSKKNTNTDTMSEDHEQMKDEHDLMMKDHKRMMKNNSMARAAEKQKMGKMKKKPMPMNDMMDMNSMDSEKTKKPADPMPADGMDHM